jgi:hypothetical protein
MLVTHHLRRETPPAPGLALGLQSVCEPRRRDRLPKETMSEGARYAQTFASLRMRLSDQRRPTRTVGGREAPVWLESLGRLFAKRTPRPKAAGPDVGAT